MSTLGADASPRDSGPVVGPNGLEVPARTLPTPSTVSVQMQKMIAAPLRPNWRQRPRTVEEWKSFVDAAAAVAVARIPGLCERLGVRFEPMMLDGVRGFRVTPETVTTKNRDRCLLHLHGGCYVLNPGEAGLSEAILMAGFGRFTVISVDYRMPPEAYFPCALDDAATAWKAVSRTTDPRKLGVFGTSAGGALTLSLVLRAKRDGLPIPAAIASGTPMSDVTKTGDTFHTNEFVDGVLVSRDGFCDAATLFYANGHDLADPLALAGVRRPQRVSPDDSDDRDTRSPVEQHRARPSKAPPGWRRGLVARLRGSIARAISVRRDGAGNRRGLRRNREFLR